MVGADPAATALAVVEMMREGRFAEIEELFAPVLRAQVSAETLRLACDPAVVADIAAWLAPGRGKITASR
jgi:hypothetical protein